MLHFKNNLNSVAVNISGFIVPTPPEEPPITVSTISASWSDIWAGLVMGKPGLSILPNLCLMAEICNHCWLCCSLGINRIHH